MHRNILISDYYPTSKAEVAQGVMHRCGILQELRAVKMARRVDVSGWSRSSTLTVAAME
jgi:hypothetical protein